MSILTDMVQGVTFRSQVTAPYTYNPNAPAAPPSAATTWLMDFVKPAIDLQTVAGPVTYAPYGEPSNDYTGPLLLGGVAMLVGLVVLVGWAGKKIG